MSANTGTIKIALQMDEKGTIRVLNSVGTTSSKAGREGKEAFDKMDRSARTFTQGAHGVSTALLKIGASIGGLLALRAALNSLKDKTIEYVGVANIQEEAETDLQAVLIATGHAAGYNIRQLKEMANRLQDLTRTGDEVILSGMAILATFKQVKGEAFETATMAALDLSKVMKQDVKSSFVQLGKALNDPIEGLTALSRVGVSFTEDQKDIIKILQESGDIMGAQKIILAELNSEFGGSAAAGINTFVFGMDQAKNSLGDYKEELGFVITKNQFFIELTHVAKEKFKEWGTQVEHNREDLMRLAKDGVLTVVDSLQLGIETLRFFHNGWLGIKLVGSAAVNALAIAMDELNPIMRKLMLPLDALFEGLKKLKVIDVNPFDSLAQGLEDFRYSSGQVTKEVLEDIEKNNRVYDSISGTLQRWKSKIAEIPVAQVEANEEIHASTKTTLDSMAGLQDLYAARAIKKQQEVADAVKTALDKAFNEIEAQENKIYSVNQKLAEDYKKLTLSSFDLERDQARQKYEVEYRLATDKIKLNEAYGLEMKRITEEETKAAEDAAKKIEDANKSMAKEMSDATIGWASNFSSDLNDIFWKSDRTFTDIGIAFEKMMTQMVIQKKIAEPFLKLASYGIESAGSWFSGLFNAHGNAFDKSGVKAYAHGGTFTNKIIDKPTMFAHGGGLGVLGELGTERPEGIFPLFRGSDGDMGVKAQIAQAPVNVYVIDQRTGNSPDVQVTETQGPDGRTQVRILIREEMKGAFADGSMDKPMRTNYGLQRAGIRG